MIQIMVFKTSIWRCSFKFFPVTIFFGGFAYILWQIIDIEERDWVFYLAIAGLLVLPAISIVLWVKCIFGKPMIEVNPQFITVRFLLRTETIAWQKIQAISVVRQTVNGWSTDFIVLRLLPENENLPKNRMKSIFGSSKQKRYISKTLSLSNVLKGGITKVASQLEEYWKIHR